MPLNQHHKSDKDLDEERKQIIAAAENPGNFDVLYEKYFKSIYVFVYRRTGDEDLAGDITSQVFLRALINIKQYKFKGLPFSSWLFRIAFNEVNLFFRKKKINRTVSIEKVGMVQIAEEASVENNEAMLQKVTASLSHLRADEVELIELRYFEKRSFLEVANIIGITENNAKVRVYRIIDKLKKIMKK